MRGSETQIHYSTGLPSSTFHKSGALPKNSRVVGNSILFGMREAVVNAVHVECEVGSQVLFITSLSLVWNKAVDMDFNSVRVQPAPQLFRHDAPVLNIVWNN